MNDTITSYTNEEMAALGLINTTRLILGSTICYVTKGTELLFINDDGWTPITLQHKVH